MIALRHLLVCLTIAWASYGCTPVPQREGGTDTQYVHWMKSREAVIKQNGWRWQGRGVLQFNGKARRINVVWQQQQGKLRIRLSGPLGMGAVSIVELSDGAMLTVGGRETYVEDIDQLAKQYMSWPLEIKRLNAWFFGVDSLAQYAEFDDAQRLTRLFADRWVLEYSDYRKVSGIFLPYKMIIERDDVHVKLKVSQWLLQ